MKKHKILFVLVAFVITTLLNGCLARQLTDKENKDFDRQREREERGKEVPEPVLPEVKDLR